MGTDHCTFETGGCSERSGTRYEDFDTAKERFIEVWTQLPDVQFENGQHFLQGDRRCSEWTLTATKAHGSKLEMDGLTFHLEGQPGIVLQAINQQHAQCRRRGRNTRFTGVRILQ